MVNRALTLTATLLFAPAAAFSQVPDVSTIPMTVIAEQKDATLHFIKGAIAAIGGGDDFNGFTGISTDFGGGELGAIIVLEHVVPDDKAVALASFQGRLEGTVKCKRVRRGDSPSAPKVHVLADGCSIVSINH
jgi:hypothetical protein